MAEYIDREKVRDAACDGCRHRKGGNGCDFPESCKRFVNALISAEPEDVAPVVHGEWFQHRNSLFHYCSKCLEDAPFSRRTASEMLTECCPHCSAKLDGGE